jgi:hypothetical protein
LTYSETSDSVGSMSEPTPHPELLREILSFCEERGIPKSVFGRAAVKDASLVTQIEAGRELRMRTIARVRDFMATHEKTGASA